MSHKCFLCGQISFKTLHEYETHRAAVHNIHVPIRPEKITGRNPARIISEAEATWLKPYLITANEPLTITTNSQEHLSACRCNACFQKLLDATVASSDALTESLNKGDYHA
jgi:hypothetical protein